ncbi:MAG: thiamine pyrophosphate-dependent enzyme, partial [Nitrospirae bacterium]|nr:thiamine pyrophosphate-dependent enzyme [Nitrospirota bacterium]
LHGRTLPVATGLRLANHDMLVVAVAGDGDCYGEGGNHLIHAMRRNINIKIFVHDNQIYGLTKGQASPTSEQGTASKNQPFGVLSEQLNPMALAVAMDCSFAARGFAADTEHLKGLMMEALQHKGFALLDILQPCITFNKLNTYEWYKQRIYYVGNEYNPEDRMAAFQKALEWGEHIPLGVIYRNNRPLFEDGVIVIRDMPLVKQTFDINKLDTILKEFY